MIKLELMKEHETEYVQKLYECSFPKIERKPWNTIMNFTKEKKYLPMVIHDENDEPVGMCFLMLSPKLLLLDYLAVDKAVQSSGIGALVLKEILRLFPGKTTIIEIEPLFKDADNYPQRIRRLKFYLKNGVHTTDIIVKLYDNEYHICYLGDEKVSYEEYVAVYKYMYGDKLADDKLFILGREKIDESLYID